MRVGQKNSLVYQWARKGTRPRQPKDQGHREAYGFGPGGPGRPSMRAACGRGAWAACWARTTLVSATVGLALVIFRVALTEAMRLRMSFRLAMGFFRRLGQAVSATQQSMRCHECWVALRLTQPTGTNFGYKH